MESIFEKYIGRYSGPSKTLQFSLIPMYETLENIEKNGIISDDAYRAEMYEKVKPLFDRRHRNYIEERMVSFEYSWDALADALMKAQHSKQAEQQEAYKALSADCRTMISRHLKVLGSDGKENKADKKGMEMRSALEPKALIDEACQYFEKDPPEAMPDMTLEETSYIRYFAKFSTYFQGYSENRENIYEADIASSVAYRLIEDNFPMFIGNMELFGKLPEDVRQEIAVHIHEQFGEDVNDIFTPMYFGNLLTQSGIDHYNSLIGGITENETTKVQGINELCNLAYQQNKLAKRVHFSLLYKQILSDRSSAASYLPPQFENDTQLLNSVKEYHQVLSATLSEQGRAIAEAFDDNAVDTDYVYIDGKQITWLSQLLYDNDWSYLKKVLAGDSDISRRVYTLTQICGIYGGNVLQAIYAQIKDRLSALEEAYGSLAPQLSAMTVQTYDELKAYLDAVQDVEKVFKIVAAEKTEEKDNGFYTVFDAVYAVLRDNIPLYNKVRSFATRKPYSEEKYKLNFDNYQLGNGWDQNKESDYETILLRRDGKYYLGVYNKNAGKKRMLTVEESPTPGAFEKMVYKLLPDPKRMLPKCFISSAKWSKAHPISQYIADGYNAGKHKKGETFDLKFCHDLIDYFKGCIALYDDWKVFDFRYSDTSTYENMADFYNELSRQNYKVSFASVSEESIRSAVKGNALYLFQIFNKDFAPGATGKKNLHTLYWEGLFSQENLARPILKLNGNAELFYRPASIENPFIHKTGSILINKRDADGNPVPAERYEAAMADAMTKDIPALRELYPELIFKTATHDIVKDRRYSRAAFSFHVPITINYGVDSALGGMNSAVLQDVEEDKGVNIIGIDRGERNLLYVCCIDRNGNILEQRSLNVIGNTDYHKKLDDIERQRDEQRKNWKSISKIADMKAGYLSLAIHEITDMMLRHNAILVLEDLNFGFKRGRFHIEKQVYQKFEKMLIEKLNYLFSKDIPADAPGGLRKGYQLTEKFDSFERLGKQTGFLFYVPARNTSHIDPLTGFVNLFTSEQLQYQSVEKARSFFAAMHQIAYDQDNGCYRFSFTYSDFALNTTDYTDHWSVYTKGEGRLVHGKKDGRDVTNVLNVTDEMRALFTKYGVKPDHDDILTQILPINEKEFWSSLLWLFKATLQMRYSDKEQDFILSPVIVNGRQYDSRTAQPGEPADGDANGAYHIALQGLRMITTRIQDGKLQQDEKGKQLYNWLMFTQTRAK